MPFGLGGRRLGSSLGPTALRIAGLQEELEEVVAQVVDEGDVTSPLGNKPGDRGKGLGYFEQVLANSVSVRKAMAEALGPRCLALAIGGDHSLALGTVSAALEHTNGDLGVLWIDAHGDINTPDTSPSGNIHGMPLAALCGLPCGDCPDPMPSQWKRLLDAVVPAQKLEQERIVWFGLRDPDPGEAERLLEKNARRAITMHELDRFGLPSMVDHAVEMLHKAGARRLWVSFDADVLDPKLAPGTGTEVRGGFRYREAHLLAELLHEVLSGSDAPFEMIGLEVVEVNPTLDRQNETAVMAVEWIGSLLGKRVLPKWPSKA